MAPRKGSRFPFDKPGRATVWGIIGTLTAAAASADVRAGLVIAIVTALIGCYDR